MLRLTTATLALFALMTTSAHAADPVDARYYSNQTTYGNAATSPIVAPPAGYEMVFIETVGRHGSRSMTSTDKETRALAVWAAAARKGALTSIGKKFGPDVRAFQRAERSIGYGLLSSVGKTEWAGIGRRTADNYAPFFEAAQSSGDHVELVTSPAYRTKQSVTAMRGSLRAAYPSLRIDPRRVDSARLMISSGVSAKGNVAIDKVLAKSNVRTAARHVLRRLYSRSYVNSLRDPVGKALDIYLLYSTAPGMKAETNRTFSRYVPLDDARLLGYAKDAQNFYRYGPGVAGQNKSFRQAKPLLADFFAQLDKRVNGGSTAAVFRAAHGETTMPFAALIKAPGSQIQASARSGYSYRNPWRGYVAGRLGGNIEWVAYRNASGEVLVTMRYNEKPVQFHRGCKAAVGAPYFYPVAELKRCLR